VTGTGLGFDGQAAGFHRSTRWSRIDGECNRRSWIRPLKTGLVYR
jgi:hypothetical protein